MAEFPLRQSGGPPVGVTENASGNAWVLLANGSVAEFNQNGTLLFPPKYNPPQFIGYMNQYPVPSFDGLASAPSGSELGLITYDPVDGNVWFYEASTTPNSNRLARLDPTSGAITEYPLLAFTQNPVIDQIIAGPDGNIYFTEPQLNAIGMFDIRTSLVSQFPMPVPDTQPQGITVGGDGNLWFTEGGQNKIGSLNPVTHVINNYAFEPANHSTNDLAEGITAGPNDTLWFVENQNNRILGFDIATQTFGVVVPPAYPAPVPNPVPFADLWSIAEGPDGNLYYTEPAFGWVGVILKPANVDNALSSRVYYGAEPQPNLANSLIASGTTGTNVFVTGPTNSDLYVMDTASLSSGYFYTVMPPVIPANDANGMVSLGNDLWFTDSTDGLGGIGMFNPATQINTDYPLPSIPNVYQSNYAPNQITADSSGNLWFTETNVNAIGELNPATGAINQTLLTSGSSHPVGITWDPYHVSQGQFWMTEPSANQVVSFNPATSGSAIAPIPNLTDPVGILADPSTGDLWITEGSAHQIIDYDPTNEKIITRFTTTSSPNQLIWGPGGNIWFTESGYVGILSPPSGQGAGGIVKEIAINGSAGALAAGPGSGPYAGTVWFTVPGTAQIGAIDATSQSLVGYVTAPSSNGLSIALGPDGNAWFTSGQGNPASMGAVVLNPDDLATQVAITTQPSNTQATGTRTLTYGFGLIVALENSAGQVDPFAQQGTITIALASDPNNGKLGGTLSLPVSDGMAIFDGLTVDTPGQGYTIQATYSQGLNAPTSSPFTVSGAPTQLKITAGPPSSVGAGLGFGVTVSALDANGYVVPTFVDPIALSIAANPPGDGVLNGVNPLGALYGSSAFAGLTIDQEGNGYKLQAADLNAGAGVSAATTAAFDVTAGPAAQFAFDPKGEPPSQATAGDNLAANAPIIVDAEDQFGQLDTTFNGAVTIGLANGATGQIVGTLTVNAVAGVAKFSNVAIQTAGTFELEATGEKLTAGTSSSITISPAAPHNLAWAAEPPSTVTQGVPFAATLDVVDLYGNVETGYSQGVSLSLAQNGSADTTDLTGTTSVTAASGVATFGGIVIGALGTSFTLAGTSGSLASGPSRVIAAVAPTLAVTTQPPATATAGSGFTVVVTVQTNLGTTDTEYSGSVGLSIHSGPQGSSIAGTASATVVSGVATINNVQLDTVGSYVLSAASGSLAPVETSSVTVGADSADAGLYVVQPPSSSLVAGAGFGFEVGSEDPYGNPLPLSGQVTVQLGANPGGSTLGGTTTATAGNNVASFSGLTLNKVGSGYSLDVTAASQKPVTISGLNVTPAAATQLFIAPADEPPSSVQAGQPFSMTVTGKDSFGNLSPLSGQVQLVLASDPSGTSIAGTTQVPASGGAASFSGLSLDLVGTGYTITASDGSLTSVTSTGIDVTPAAATHLAIPAVDQPPASVEAGQGFSMTVIGEDQFGNSSPITGQVSLALAANPGSTTLGGTLQLTVNQGKADFTGLMLDKVASGYTITASDGSLPSATSGAIDVTPAGASALAILPAGEPASKVEANQPFAMTVVALDPFGNVTTLSGQVNVAIDNNPGGAILGGTRTVTAGDGAASFTNLSLNIVGTGYTLLASGGQTASGNPLSPAISTAIQVTPAVATQLVIPGTGEPPAGVTAGIAFPLTVDAEDSSGNLDSNYQGPITIVSPSIVSGTTSVNAINGVASFTNLIIDTAGTYQLRAGSGLLTQATSTSITVSADAQHPAGLSWAEQPPSPIDRGAGFPIMVNVVDKYGNIEQGYNGSVTLALGANPGGATLGGTTSEPAQDGTASFSGLTISAVGNGYTLIATSGSLTSTASSPIDVNPVPAAALQLSTLPPTSVEDTQSFSLAVTAVDKNGFDDPDFTGSVQVTILTPAGSKALGGVTTATAVAGVATFSDLTLSSVGTYVLQISSNGLTPTTTGDIVVTTGQAAKLSIATQPPASTTAGDSFGFTVQAEDPTGVATDTFQGLVSAQLVSTATGAILSGILTARATNGLATFSGLSLDLAGSGYTIEVASNNLSPATTAPFTIAPSYATTLQITTATPSHVTAGVPFSMTVVAQDRYGNTATDFNGPVSLGLTIRQARGLTGTLAATAVNGVASFPAVALDVVGSDYLIQAFSLGLKAATSTFVSVTPAAATKLYFSAQPPPDMPAGTAFGLVVEAVDPYGNLAGAFRGTVSLSLVGPSGPVALSGGPLSVNATGGVADFPPTLAMDRAGSGFTIQAATAGLAAASSNPVTITSLIYTHLAVTVEPPSSVGPGSPFGFVVAAEDQFGNVSPTFSGPITIALPAGSGSALGGTTTVDAVGGLASFQGLTLAGAATPVSILATTAGLPGTSTTPVGLTTPTALVNSTTPLVTVTSVQIVKHKIKRKLITQIVVGFSGPLNAATANNAADYQLIVAGKKKSFTAKNAKHLRIFSAAYNPASNTVTLVPPKKLPPKLMEFIVVGQPPSGVEDSFGRLIDGNGDGQPGGSTIAVVKGKRVTVTNAIDLALQSGNLTGPRRNRR